MAFFPNAKLKLAWRGTIDLFSHLLAKTSMGRKPSKKVAWISSGRLRSIVLQRSTPAMEIEVRARSRAVIRMSASVSGEMGEDGNLLVVVSGTKCTESRARSLGYVKSGVGFYRYLRAEIQKGQLTAEVLVDDAISAFRLMSWNSAGAIVLSELTLFSDRAEMRHAELACDDAHTLDQPEIMREAGLRLNLLTKSQECGAVCIAHCEKWFTSMDAVADRHKGKGYERRRVFIEAKSGELLPGSMQNTKPAFLVIPASIDDYLYQIGDKSRNMLHKAQRMGYSFAELGPEGFEEDIVDIRTSDPMRQGRPIPEYYYSNPPLYVLSRSSANCTRHTEHFFGIFREGKLVSYITLFMFGELAQINHILCHAEHVKHGVMNLNVYHVVDQLIRKFTWVRAINYLYVSEASAGIDLFKRSVGFRAERLVAYDSLLPAKEVAPLTQKSVKPAITAARERVPAAKKKICKWEFIRTSLVRSALLQQIEEKLGPNFLMVATPKEENFVKFISAALDEMAHLYEIGARFVVPFPWRVDASVYPDAAAYIARRFKGNPVPDNGFTSGFKGGSFQALAYLEIKDEDNRFFNGVIVLEKISR